MSENQKIHQKLGPAFMYTEEVVNWFAKRDLHRYANSITEFAAGGKKIQVSHVKFLLEDMLDKYRMTRLMRRLESDIVQYQNFK